MVERCGLRTSLHFRFVLLHYYWTIFIPSWLQHCMGPTKTHEIAKIDKYSVYRRLSNNCLYFDIPFIGDWKSLPPPVYAHALNITHADKSSGAWGRSLYVCVFYMQTLCSLCRWTVKAMTSLRFWAGALKFSLLHLLHDFSLTVKAAPHECVIMTSQP